MKLLSILVALFSLQAYAQRTFTETEVLFLVPSKALKVVVFKNHETRDACNTFGLKISQMSDEVLYVLNPSLTQTDLGCRDLDEPRTIELKAEETICFDDLKSSVKLLLPDGNNYNFIPMEETPDECNMVSIPEDIPPMDDGN